MTLTRSVLQMVDFKEQPLTQYLVFPPSGDRAPVAIDRWEIHDYEFRGYVGAAGNEAPVVVLPADSNWVIYSRTLIKLLSTEEALREGISHKLAMRDVERELLKNEPPTVTVVGVPEEFLADLATKPPSRDPDVWPSTPGPGQYL